MLTAIRYLPLLLSSLIMIASVLFKVLMDDDMKVTYLFRDMALFFILYYVISKLTVYIEKIFKNYWKMQ